MDTKNTELWVVEDDKGCLIAVSTDRHKAYGIWERAFAEQGRASCRNAYTSTIMIEDGAIVLDVPQKPDFRDIKVGMVFKEISKQFNATNYARVTRIQPTIQSQRIFYAVFVDPKDFTKNRLPDDMEFAVWDFSYEGLGGDEWILVSDGCE